MAAFWGVVVRAWRPAFHPSFRANGKIRITRATLGMGSGGSTEKIFVQCKVEGRNSIPFVLCVLLPNKSESCSLDLIFGERDIVEFSVVGPSGATVHLTGYHLCSHCQLSNNDHTESSFGIDIEHTESEDSSEDSENNTYDYEDSFIDDSEASVVGARRR